MKEHGLRRDIMRGWMAPADDKRQAEDPHAEDRQCVLPRRDDIRLAFAYFFLSARA